LNGVTKAGVAHGLTDGDLFTAPASSAAGVMAVFQQLNPSGTVNAGTNVIELTTGTFANASQRRINSPQLWRLKIPQFS
jgi:hypothetical protein